MTMKGRRRAPARRADAVARDGDGLMPGVPLELWLGSERIAVSLDARGIYFEQGASRGYLPWEEAVALSLLPAEWRPGRPAA